MIYDEKITCDAISDHGFQRGMVTPVIVFYLFSQVLLLLSHNGKRHNGKRFEI